MRESALSADQQRGKEKEAFLCRFCRPLARSWPMVVVVSKKMSPLLPPVYCYKLLVYYHTTFHTVRIAQHECPHGMHPPAKYKNGGKVKVPSLIIWLKCLSKNGTREVQQLNKDTPSGLS